MPLSRLPLRGTIAQLDARGFGFIRRAGGVRYFFARDVVAEGTFENLRVGEAVLFTEGNGITEPRAIKVWRECDLPF